MVKEFDCLKDNEILIKYSSKFTQTFFYEYGVIVYDQSELTRNKKPKY
jgi:hypothetical protein